MNTQYAYKIFVSTNFPNKGYGCFGIRKIEHNKFIVATAFCHPKDGNKFSKKLAKKIIDGRFEKNVYREVEFHFNRKFSIRLLIDKFMDSSYAKLDVPTWALKCFKRKHFVNGLEFDHMRAKDLAVQVEAEAFDYKFLRSIYGGVQ